MHFIKPFYSQRSVRLGCMDLFIEIFISNTEITNLTLLNVITNLMIQFIIIRKERFLKAWLSIFVAIVERC